MEVGSRRLSARVDVAIVALPSLSLSSSTPRGTLGTSLDVHPCSRGVEVLARWWDSDRKGGLTWAGRWVHHPLGLSISLLSLSSSLLLSPSLVAPCCRCRRPLSLVLRDRRSAGWWHEGRNGGLTWAGGWSHHLPASFSVVVAVWVVVHSGETREVALEV